MEFSEGYTFIPKRLILIFIPKGDSLWTFGEEHRYPAWAGRLILKFRWMGFVLLIQSQHGRDSRAPLFCSEKSYFKETLI